MFASLSCDCSLQQPSLFLCIHIHPLALSPLGFSFIGFRRTYPFYYSSLFLSSALTSRQCSNLGFKSIFRESASRSAALLAIHVVSQQYCIFCWLNYDQVGWWLVVWNATTPKTFMSLFFFLHYKLFSITKRTLVEPPVYHGLTSTNQVQSQYYIDKRLVLPIERSDERWTSRNAAVVDQTRTRHGPGGIQG